MDILLVNTSAKKMSRHASLTPPLGPAYIVSMLIEAGYGVSAIDFNGSDFDSNRLKRALKRGSLGIIGISAPTILYAK